MYHLYEQVTPCKYLTISMFTDTFKETTFGIQTYYFYSYLLHFTQQVPVCRWCTVLSSVRFSTLSLDDGGSQEEKLN